MDNLDHIFASIYDVTGTKTLVEEQIIDGNAEEF